MSRDTFLARVRQAAEVGRAYRVHLKPVPENIGYVGVKEDLVERFAAEVDAVGGQSYIVPDLAGAKVALHRLLEEAGATSALAWEHELLDRLGLAELLAAPGVQLHTNRSLAALPPDEQRRTMLACDIGITSCDCAIAETGTLMVTSRPGQERVASLLPPFYVSIVERKQIVPDLIDAFGILGQNECVHSSKFKVQSNPQILNLEPGTLNLPSNVTFITGPSKTGDIELQLTTGVHGPGKWRVIVID
jgi:L-lactate dehydrogenase complex protein LldG